MKLIATNIPSPLDKKALEIYASEFYNGYQGFVLFPENSIQKKEIAKIRELSDKRNVGIVGTLKTNNYQMLVIISNNKVIIGPKSYMGEFIPYVTTNSCVEQLMAMGGPVSNFYAEDKQLNIKIGDKEFKTITRIHSDLALPYLRKNIADLLLIPSTVEHPNDWFEKNIKMFPKHLAKDAKIIYSTLETTCKKCPTKPIGIYNSKLAQIGENRGNYTLLNTEN